MEPLEFTEEQLPHFVNSTSSSVFSRQTQTDFFDSGSLPSVANTSDHPLQQADWIPLNNELRQFGFDPIVLSHQSKLQNNSESGYTILDNYQSAALRTTLEALLSENKRRQELVNQLLTSQNTLQNQYEEENRKHENCKAELLSYKALFETERIKCQEMELARKDEISAHADKVRKLEEDNSKMFLKSKYLEKENHDMNLLMSRSGIRFKRENMGYEPVSSLVDTGSARPSPESSFPKQIRRKKKSHTTRKEKLLQQYETKLLNMQREFEGLRMKMSSNSSPETPKCSPDEEISDSSSSLSVQVPASTAQTIKTQTTETKALLPTCGTPSCRNAARSPDFDKSSSVSSASTEISDASFLYKRLKLAEKKLKEAKRAMKDYEKEAKALKEQLDQRPKAKEFARLVVRCKELEKIVEENNLGLKLSSSPGALEKSIHGCTHVGNIDFLPIDVCRQHLKDVSSQLGVNNLLDIPSRLEQIERMDTLATKTLQVLRKIDLISRVDREDIVDYGEIGNERDGFLEARTQSLLTTINAWKNELTNLKCIWDALVTLSQTLRPWKRQHSILHSDKGTHFKQIKTEDIVAYIEHLGGECQLGPIKHRKGPPTEKQLLSVVEHFMKLFDIENVSGVFARMNDVYVKHSEMVNILKTTRELLGLESNCSLGTIVNAVGKLSKAKSILHVDNVDSVIQDLKQYDSFYVAFKSVIDALLSTLGVSQVDEILPAVQALIRYP